MEGFVFSTALSQPPSLPEESLYSSFHGHCSLPFYWRAKLGQRNNFYSLLKGYSNKETLVNIRGHCSQEFSQSGIVYFTCNLEPSALLKYWHKNVLTLTVPHCRQQQCGVRGAAGCWKADYLFLLEKDGVSVYACIWVCGCIPAYTFTCGVGKCTSLHWELRTFSFLMNLHAFSSLKQWEWYNSPACFFAMTARKHRASL